MISDNVVDKVVDKMCAELVNVNDCAVLFLSRRQLVLVLLYYIFLIYQRSNTALDSGIKAGIKYHNFTFYDAMSEIQHLGDEDKGIVINCDNSFIVALKFPESFLESWF